MESQTKDILTLGALGVGSYLIFTKVIKPKVKQLQVAQQVTRMRVTLPGIAFSGDNVDFKLYVQNPNPQPLVISAIVGDVFVTYTTGMLKLGNVFKYGSTVIKPLAETPFPFSVRLKLLPLVAYFNAIFAGKATNQVLSFVGTITVNGVPTHIKESVRISGK